MVSQRTLIRVTCRKLWQPHGNCSEEIHEKLRYTPVPLDPGERVEQEHGDKVVLAVEREVLFVSSGFNEGGIAKEKNVYLYPFSAFSIIINT